MSVIALSSNGLPAPVADHVAAVTLFGPPTSVYSSSLWGGPLPALAAA